MSRHVERLFSAAYDGELDPEAQGRFDRHLAECPACAGAFAELTTAVDVLREQGPVRMPRPVRLPEGSPVERRRLAGLLVRPSRGRGLMAGLAGAGTVAVAAAIVALVVVGPLNPGIDHQRGASSSLAAGADYGSPNVALPAAASGGAFARSSGDCAAAGCSAAQVAPAATQPACAATTLSTSASAAAQIPTGFNNHVTSDDGSTRVVIATQVSSYAPGETIDVYARVIDDDTGAVYLPCTTLEVSSSKTALSALPGGPILATPAPGIAVGGGPVLQVTLPVSTATDQTYQIVVEVPVGTGEAQARQVDLSISVT